MFFWASKLIGVILVPSNILLFSLCLGLVGAWVGRRWGRRLTGLVAAVLLAVTLTPLPDLMLQTLEDRFPVPVLEGPPAGIIVLGGAPESRISRLRGVVSLNGAAERLTEGIALARKYPDAVAIFTGGSANPFDQQSNEAVVMERLLADLGVAPGRFIFEGKARNTAENAALTDTYVVAKDGETWLLVTSAFHMPRSVGVFRQTGLDVTPWPVDFRTVPGRIWPDLMKLNVARSLATLDLAVREYIGLVAYYLTGRTNQLFPGG